MKGPKVKHYNCEGDQTADFNLDLNVPEYDFSNQITTNSISLTQDMSELNPQSNTDLFYGFDLPMTIANTDWHWSNQSFAHSSPEKRALQRSLLNTNTSGLAKYENRLFSFGNYSIIENAQLLNNTQILKTLDIHANNPQIAELNADNPKSLSSAFNLEFELHKAKIRLDSPCFEHARASTSSRGAATNPPGDVHTHIDFSKSIDVQAAGKAKSGTIFSSSTSGDKRQSSSSSDPKGRTLNLNQRSESADSRPKNVDYSQPRKCVLHTKPGFQGLGIHIACDKNTRCSPYIYQVEANSPGLKAGLLKNDYILEINGEEVVFLDFNALIGRIQSLIKEDNLCLTVGSEKVYKKWMKSRTNDAAAAGNEAAQQQQTPKKQKSKSFKK
jgi:hypothetical protein